MWSLKLGVKGKIKTGSKPGHSVLFQIINILFHKWSTVSLFYHRHWLCYLLVIEWIIAHQLKKKKMLQKGEQIMTHQLNLECNGNIKPHNVVEHTILTMIKNETQCLPCMAWSKLTYVTNYQMDHHACFICQQCYSMAPLFQPFIMISAVLLKNQ